VDSGENRVRVGLTIKPSLGKRGVTIFKETLIATKATPSQEEEPEQNLVSLSPDLLKLEVHFGISPQLVLDFMSEY
jgi:hypothetical protein